MSKIAITPESFTITGDQNSEHFEYGTVTLNLRTGAVVAEASRSLHDGVISVRGFVGRYQTSRRAWRATVVFKTDGTMRYADFGYDDRSGRFKKQDAISYEPDTYNQAAR